MENFTRVAHSLRWAREDGVAVAVQPTPLGASLAIASTLPPEQWQKHFARGLDSVLDFFTEMTTSRAIFERGLRVLHNNRGYMIDGASTWMSEPARAYGRSIPGWYSAKQSAQLDVEVQKKATQSSSSYTGLGWLSALLYDRVYHNHAGILDSWKTIGGENFTEYACIMLQRSQNGHFAPPKFPTFQTNQPTFQYDAYFRIIPTEPDPNFMSGLVVQAWTEAVLDNLVRVAQNRLPLQQAEGGFTWSPQAHTFIERLLLKIPSMMITTDPASNSRVVRAFVVPKKIRLENRYLKGTEDELIVSLFEPKENGEYPLLERAYENLRRIVNLRAGGMAHLLAMSKGIYTPFGFHRDYLNIKDYDFYQTFFTG